MKKKKTHKFCINQKPRERISKNAESVSGNAFDIRLIKNGQQEIENAKLAAEDASREKSYFLANMGHEIRTPLGIILGYADILNEKGLTEKDRLNCAKVISENGKKLIHLIDSIFDFSKVEGGFLDFEKVNVSISKTLESVCSLFRMQADAKQLGFTVETDKDLPPFILTDPIRLRQILFNVIGNAIKFTTQGDISVTAKLISDVDGAGDGKKDLVALIIKDTGIGLSEEQNRNLFNPFMQADRSPSRSFGGIGLGLALSRRIAQALGGDLVLQESKPGVGSTFMLTIPAEQDQSQKVKKRNEEMDIATIRYSPSLEGLKVLVAEDSPDNQFLIKHIFDSKGAKIEIVDDGRIAVEKLKRESFDIVLMDMQMPRLDGYDATREIRLNGYEGPILALTANAMRSDRDKCLKAGCTEYLSKPFDPSKLFHIVGDLVRPFNAS